MSLAQGISIKDILNNSQNDPLDATTGGFTHSDHDPSQYENCFYDMCRKKKVFRDRLTCCKIKGSVNNILCFLFTLMTTCLFLAVIAPLVSTCFYFSCIFFTFSFFAVFFPGGYRLCIVSPMKK
jgi:hypothetical protein